MKFQDLPRRTALGKVLHDKNPKNDGYQIVSISKVCLFYGSFTHIERRSNFENQQLVEELFKTILRKSLKT